MCTAIRWKRYAGRTLDLECSYGEQVVVTPRNYLLHFRRENTLDSHYAMIGIAHVEGEYPLYYDGVNEKGLAMAGLNFPGNACYHRERQGRDNVASFELIPWVLGQCGSVDEAELLLGRANLLDLSFSEELPRTPLHWLIADRKRSLVAEPMSDGLRLYENPTDVMTNNPPFPRQRERQTMFLDLTPAELEPDETDRETAGRGLGAVGLPGDWSSPSRFIRAAFVREHAAEGAIGQFFHLLSAVEVPEGCIRLQNGQPVKTVYTSVYDLERGLCCYTTYENHRLRGVDLHREHLDGSVLAKYPLRRQEELLMEN